MTEEFNPYLKERRLHPLTIFYRTIMALPQLAIVLYIIFTRNATEEWFFLILAIFFGIISFPFIILNYYFFTFYINPKEISIKSGVLSKRQRLIPIDRIQNIEITQNLLQRVLGLAKVQLDTAGEASSEGQLEYVSKKDADNLRNVIKLYQSGINDNVNSIGSDLSIEESDFNERQLFKLSIKDNIYQGMLRFRPLILVFIFWLFSMAQQLYLIPDSEDWDIDTYFMSFSQLDGLTIALMIMVAIIGIFVTSWIADIVLTVVNYYGFKLSVESDKLHTEQGLLSRRKGTIPLRKLQMMVLKSNLIQRRFGFWGFMFETAGFGYRIKGNQTAIPFAIKERIIELMHQVVDFDYPESFIRVSKKTIRRAMIRYLLFFLPIMTGLYFALSSSLWLLLLSPLLYVAALLRWQYRGYRIIDDMIFVKQGFWMQKISIIPIDKIQTLNVAQSFFQRRLGLATLHIDTAASGVLSDASIIDIERDDAFRILEEISERFNFILGNNLSGNYLKL